ncbi:Auxin-responsive protein IAA6 [Striga hermonthica]|uniref:Auxin-responsive protein IAA6 n=1 Tax=Striga hermonthica TaxID=68872 RepID=A0A9N7MPQ4_STRHE|nr:Auxin-responsive protein IAA6 [Striga hermonthica]
MGLETERRLGLPGGGDGEVERNEMKRVFSDISSASGNGGEEERKTEAVESKNQVVGRPLVAAYRRKHNFGRAKMYVKVSMDGNLLSEFRSVLEVSNSASLWIHENFDVVLLDELDLVYILPTPSSPMTKIQPQKFSPAD